MRVRTIAVMFGWLVLFGCDDDDDGDDDKKVGTSISGVQWDPPGCDGQVTSGTVTDANGNRGKVSVSWYLPAVAITFTLIALVVWSGRERCSN